MEKVWLKQYDSWVTPKLDYPDGTLYEVFARSAEKWGNKVCSIFLDGELTYGELKDKVDSFAAALSAHGIKKEDRIVISLPSSPQFIVAYYALMKLGAVAVMLNPLSVEREILFKFRDSGVRGVIALDMFFDQFIKPSQEVGLDTIIFCGVFDFHPSQQPDETTDRGEGILDMRSMVEKGGPDITPIDVKQDELAVIIYTGGTTGDPKGVMQSHRNHICNSWAITTWGQFNENDRGLVVLPLFHGFGMAVMNCLIIRGGSLVLIPRFEIKDVFEQIDRHRPTIVVGVPTMYVAINNFPEREKYDISSLRASMSGGAPLPISVKQEFEHFTGGSLVEGFGLTESTCAVCANPVDGTNKEGSIGIPMSDTELAIVDLETGTKFLGIEEEGEIVLKSPSVMFGYYNNPDATRETIRDGWLYTGDIGKMDEDGYFFILDRKKEMIIAGGFNIYPKEVENILQSHPGVMEAAVIGVPDSYRGETVKAFITPKAGITLTEEEMTLFCKENMVKYMVPKSFEFRENLPKSPIGKILKKELKAEEINKAK
jgi:long-chain acyl-CoA synthetase